MAKLIVTIDGPAGSGKSTIARLLAERLGASFLDTGAMYRAVTLAAMQAGVELSDQQKLLEILRDCEFKFTAKKNEMEVSINGVDVTNQIRQPKVTANSRYAASAINVRERLVEMQREFAAGEEKIVTEGRDQGTVAFPDAGAKFFLTAQPQERARRRQAEHHGKGGGSLEQIRTAIEKRDKMDESRTVGPLKAADDAVIVDTTKLNIEQVVERLLSYIEQNG